LSGFSLLWQAPEANNLKEERFVWLTVSEVSLHGQVAPLLLGLWQERTSLWKGMAEESSLPHGYWKAEKDRELQGMLLTFKGPLLVMYLLVH
jgi:hypothetical protein